MRQTEHNRSASLDQRRRDRRGSALIQMAVTMTVMSALLAVSGTALIRLYRQQGRQLERIAQTAAWQRLARDFRTDVHATRAVRVSGNNADQLLIRDDDGIVVWTVSDDEIQRVHLKSATEAPDHAALLERPGERYAFPAATLSFDVITESDRADMAAVVVTEATPGGTATPRTLRIKARVGLDLRFAPAGAVSSTVPAN